MSAPSSSSKGAVFRGYVLGSLQSKRETRLEEEDEDEDEDEDEEEEERPFAAKLDCRFSSA